MRKEAVNLKEVARLANCSPATVSRVVNNPDSVTKALRDRVRDAISKLDYVPNSAARSLRSRRSGLIAAIVPTLDHTIFIHLLNGLERSLQDTEYSLIVASTNFDLETEFNQVTTMLERGAEAIVLVGQLRDPRTVNLIARKRIPIVTTYTFASSSVLPCVGVDNENAAGNAARHLVELGHKRLAIISGFEENNDRVQQRISGFLDELLRSDIHVSQSSRIQTRYGIREGADAICSLLDQDLPPTAVFCTSDVLAFGVLSGVASRGLTIPSDISVVGFDNVDYTEFLSPALTTVEVPGTHMGEAAGRLLLEQISEAGSGTASIEMPSKLIVRKSTGIPPS